MNYENKYFKYKHKYFKFKNLIGGFNENDRVIYNYRRTGIYAGINDKNPNIIYVLLDGDNRLSNFNRKLLEINVEFNKGDDVEFIFNKLGTIICSDPGQSYTNILLDDSKTTIDVSNKYLHVFDDKVKNEVKIIKLQTAENEILLKATNILKGVKYEKQMIELYKNMHRRYKKKEQEIDIKIMNAEGNKQLTEQLTKERDNLKERFYKANEKHEQRLQEKKAKEIRLKEIDAQIKELKIDAKIKKLKTEKLKIIESENERYENLVSKFTKLDHKEIGTIPQEEIDSKVKILKTNKLEAEILKLK